jgi:hypothetical protein
MPLPFASKNNERYLLRKHNNKCKKNQGVLAALLHRELWLPCLHPRLEPVVRDCRDGVLDSSFQNTLKMFGEAAEERAVRVASPCSTK